MERAWWTDNALTELLQSLKRIILLLKKWPGSPELTLRLAGVAGKTRKHLSKYFAFSEISNHRPPGPASVKTSLDSII
jgi:hypothetical protein